MAETQLRELINKRKHIKSLLTRLQKYVDSFSDSDDIRKLKIHLQRSETVLSELIQREIECLDCDTDHVSEREEFEIKYYKTITKAQTIIETAC